MLENKKRAAPKVIRGERRALLPRREPHYLVISRFSVLRRAKRQRDEWDPTPTYEFSHSLPNHRKQEENSLQFNKKEEGCSYTSWYRKGSGRAPTPATQKRGPSNFLRNVRELLTISSSSSTQGRELMIKKKGWSSFKLPALTREVWSSLRPSKGDEKSSTSSSGTRSELNPSYSWWEKTAPV